MAVIADALGHADELMTRKHYAHLGLSYLASTIREHAVGMGLWRRTTCVPSDDAARTSVFIIGNTPMVGSAKSATRRYEGGA